MSFNLFGEYSEQELLITDITFLGLDQKAWDYSRGARTERIYRCVEAPHSIKIRDHYTYTYTNGNRDIASLARTIEWYDMDETVRLTKPIVKEFTAKSLGQLNREIRIGRMTDLRENAKLLPGGQALVDDLYAWYGDLIIQYEDQGNLGFENALKTEDDTSRRDVLNTPLVAPGTTFDGVTPMQLLSFQLIGAYVWS